MSTRDRSQNVRLKYTFIKAHRQEFNTAMMCRLLDVSRSGFYAWLQNPLSDRAREDQRLLALIVAAYKASHGVYGAPRIFLDLRETAKPVVSIALLELCGPITSKRSTATVRPGTPKALPLF